jgi:tetratricopeptide (TPR) repeat protein
MYYEYSGLASQASEPRELQVSLLRKALDLDPDYRDARLRLGDLLMWGRDYAGALAEFNRLKKVEPEQAFHLFHSIAYAAYLTGDKENARANAKRAADYAKEPDQKAILEQLQVALEERPMERSETITRPRSEEEDEPQPAPQGRAIRETPQLRMRPALTAVEGALDQIDCLGSAARIRMTVAGRPVRLLIDKPGSIEVRGTKTGSFDLRCGPQKPLRTVRVEYLPNEDAERGSIGLVRVMEIR